MAGRTHGCIASIVTAALLAGCATSSPPAPELSAEKSAANFAARTLGDPALHRFLGENLGRDPGTAWDFESLSWVAFYFHPSLEVARAQWAGARAAVQGASQRPNPTLTFTPGYNTTREPGLSPWMPAINLDFLLNTVGKRERQVAAAQHDAEAARLGVFTAAWQVRTELRRALADTTIASRRETQLRTQAGAQRALLALLEQRFEAGGIAATEVSVARTVLLRVESTVAEAHGQALAARSRVSSALGLPATALEGIELPSPSAPMMSGDTLAAARQEALRTRPDILIALAKYHAAQAALELEYAKQAPDFHLGPGYQWDQGANKWTLGIGVELPVFHRNEAGIAAATAHRAEAAAQFNLTQAQAVAAIDQSVAAGQAAQFQLEHARQLREETRRQVARVQQRIEAGAGDQVELRTAQIEVAIAEAAILDAENAAITAAGQLEDAVQLPLPRLAALASPELSARTHE